MTRKSEAYLIIPCCSRVFAIPEDDNPESIVIFVPTGKLAGAENNDKAITINDEIRKLFIALIIT
ncbi:MAG TPA: hypothetical protein VJK09_03040 [Candidatus Paceibacterota bacterium]